MKQTQAQLDAHKKYLASLDEFKIRTEKGKKDVYKEQAAYRGLSLNSYVISLIERDGYRIEREQLRRAAVEKTLEKHNK